MMAEVIGIVTIGGTDYPVSAFVTLPEPQAAPAARTLVDRMLGRNKGGSQ